MNKSQLATEIALSTNMSEAAVLRVLDQFEQTTTEALKASDQVLLTGFVKFATVDQPAKTRRNPQTGEPVEVPAKRIVKIKPMATLKRDVNS
jgi:DNA-binding protein HU-beta